MSLQHSDLQLLQAQTEKTCFECKLKLERVSGEKRAVLEDNQSLERDRDELRRKLTSVTEENVQLTQRRVPLQRTPTVCLRDGGVNTAGTVTRVTGTSRHLRDQYISELICNSISAYRGRHYAVYLCLRQNVDCELVSCT